jgi:hypothetical protein
MRRIRKKKSFRDSLSVLRRAKSIWWMIREKRTIVDIIKGLGIFTVLMR